MSNYFSDKDAGAARPQEARGAGGFNDQATRLIVGDCRQILPGMPDGSAHLAVTDPPFNIGLTYHDRYDDSQPDGQFLGLMEQSMREVYRVLRPDGSLFLFMGPKYQAQVLVL